MSAPPPIMPVRLAAQVAALPELERAVYRAVAIDGLSYREISDRLALSPREVEAALARALVALDAGLSP